MKPQAPCKDCPDRRQFCHPDCERWAVYEAQRTEYYRFKEEEAARREAERFLIEQKIKRKK